MGDLGWHYFTPADRARQLAELATACDAAAAALELAGERIGSDYATFAERVRELAAREFDQRDLTLLTRELPGVPVWLDPKAVDAGVPPTDVREHAAAPVRAARGLALSLRSLAIGE